MAVALQTFPNARNPSRNAIGVITSSEQGRNLVWKNVVDAIPPLRSGPTRVGVTVSAGVITVTVGGFTVLAQHVGLPKDVYVGFTAGNGLHTDLHLISSVQLSYR